MTDINPDHALPVLGNDSSGRAGYPFLLRWLHWLLSASAVVLVVTGLSLHAVARPDWSLFSGVLPPCFWPGRVGLWHLAAAAVFAPAVIATLWICRNRGFWKRPTLFVLLIGGLLAVLSGLLLMNCFGSFAVRTCALWVHAVTGLLLLPIALLWHGVSGLTWRRGDLVSAFHPWANPRWVLLPALIPPALVTTCLILGDLPVHWWWRTLAAGRIPAADAPPADLASLPWNDAQPLKIHLANGQAFKGGQTKVTLQALHDGNELFVKAQWLDDQQDRRYLPWRKVSGGWRQMATGPTGGPLFDECRYYEDKFALAFPIAPDWQFDRFGCAACCHAGGGRAYGYKGSNRPLDVWHWKATRTDPVGQADDKYWSEVDFQAKDVGRHGDPKKSGGYQKNIAESGAHPAFLPRDFSALGGGIIPAESAVEYTEEAAAKLPEGTTVPGIVASAFVGDRGDIRCRSSHKDGRWTLYLRRKLDTGSPCDVKFSPGRSYPFACAAFDRCSKRHAYHFGTYRLELQK